MCINVSLGDPHECRQQWYGHASVKVGVRGDTYISFWSTVIENPNCSFGLL